MHVNFGLVPPLDNPRETRLRSARTRGARRGPLRRTSRAGKTSSRRAVPGGSPPMTEGANQHRLETLVDDYCRWLGGGSGALPEHRPLVPGRPRLVRLVGRAPRGGRPCAHASLAEGYLAELGRARYSTRTVNRRLSALRGFFRWLVREGHCSSEEASAISSPKVARTLPKVMSDAEAAALLESCDTGTAEGLRDRAFLELLTPRAPAFRGLRRALAMSSFPRRRCASSARGRRSGSFRVRLGPRVGVALPRLRASRASWSQADERTVRLHARKPHVRRRAQDVLRAARGPGGA